MKDFEYGYSWMPAAHDAYPGWDHVTVVGKLPMKAATESKGKGFYMLRRGDKAFMCFTDGSPAEAKGLSGRTIFSRVEQERKHCSHIMFNASEAPRSPKGMRHDYRIATKKDHIIFQDSGGYQLVSGAKLFVDPHAVAHAHNVYAHEGVGLDIPTGSLGNIKLIVESSKIQNLNNALILKDLNKDVALFATSQGVTPEGRKQYLDVMMDSEFHGITIAGLRPILGIYDPTPVQLMLHLLYVVLRTRKRATRYHILGVSTFSTMLMLACAAEHLKIRITSDSARHILIGAGGSTLSAPNLKQVKSEAGTRQKGAALGAKGSYLTGCTCRMCNNIVFDHMYSESRFLQTHAFNSLTLASTHVREEAKVIMATEPCMTLGKNFHSALELLKTIKTSKDAFDLLKQEVKETVKRPSLFNMASTGEKTMTNSELEKQMAAVIDRYKQYHKTGKIDPSWIIKEKK